MGGTSHDADRPGPQDAAHLDEDAECLEDPVHCGDARHQHDLHRHDAAGNDEAAGTPDDEPAAQA